MTVRTGQVLRVLHAKEDHFKYKLRWPEMHRQRWC